MFLAHLNKTTAANNRPEVVEFATVPAVPSVIVRPKIEPEPAPVPVVVEPVRIESVETVQVLRGETRRGDFVHNTQKMGTERDFRNVSEHWLNTGTMTIDQTLEKLERERGRTIDHVVPFSQLRAVADQSGFGLINTRTGERFTLSDDSLDQFSERSKVGATLPRRLLNGDQDDVETLAIVAQNGLRKLGDKTCLLRVRERDSQIRAFLSEEYAVIDHRWFLELLGQIIPGGIVSHFRSPDGGDSIFFNLLIPDSIRAESDSEYGGMLACGNGETGRRRIQSMPSIFRAICQNGCIWDLVQGIAYIMQVHRGEIDLATLAVQIRDNLNRQIPLLGNGIDAMMKTRSIQSSVNVSPVAVIGSVLNTLNVPGITREQASAIVTGFDDQRTESGSSLPPSEDFSDENDTFEDFNGKENAVVAFGKELEANRSATIQGWTYRIEPQQDRTGFQIVTTGPDGASLTICSGFYGFAFDTFDRTVGYAVSKARGRFVCHPETLDNGCQIETRFHKRRGVFVYVVTLPEPVKGSKFDTLDNRAKKSGGWYAREYRPEYQRGGFMFTDKRQADRFANDFTPSAKVATMRHNEKKPAPAPSEDFSDAEPSTEYSERISRNVDHIARMSTAARLEELADGMQKTIDEKTRPMSQNWTVKRGREYNSRCHDGRHYQRVQEALRVLAAHWRAGTVPDSMQQLKAKSAILPLLSCRWDSCTDRGTDEFTNHSPLAVELREMIEANRTGEHREQLAAAKRVAEIKAAEDALRLRNVPGFFPTPPALVDRMVDQAQFPQSPSEDFSVLEPSAGIGSIADGIASEIPPDRIKCVEISSACCSVLELKGYNVGEGDFLQIPAGERFDRILMNPPFENGQDIDHVRHAFSLLKSGGRLVAIMSEGSFTTTKRKAVEFVEWIDSQCAEYETIRGAFDNSTAFRSSGVTVRLVTIDKD